MYINSKVPKILCIIIMLCGLCSCDNTTDRQQLFYDEMKEINEHHALETSRVKEVNIRDYTPTLDFREVGFTEEELDSLTNFESSVITTDVLSYEQAEEDIELAFRIFKNCYGGYFYFGGDEAFETAKEQVISDCRMAREDLTVGILQESLTKHLGFVKDGHFLIDGMYVFDKAKYYSNEEATFLKDSKGYYLEQRRKKRYVISVDDIDTVEKYMMRSINNKGKLVYKLGILSTEEQNIIEVTFKDGTEYFALSLLETQNINSKENYSYQEINDVPVVSMRSFLDEAAHEQFIESAETIKNSKISILDIRRNRGGLANYVKDWLDIYDPALSEYIKGNTFAQRYSRASFYLGHSRFQADLPEKNERVAMKQLKLYEVGTNGWNREETQTFRRSENSNILFILIDNNTFSAAEIFLAALRNKDNVIFVGTNSSGAMISGAEVKAVLPNSKIHIQCGDGLRFYFDETVFTEETGFCPDIWVDSDSLEHVLNMISYYKLDMQ